jgi:hypothetical protein
MTTLSEEYFIRLNEGLVEEFRRLQKEISELLERRDEAIQLVKSGVKIGIPDNPNVVFRKGLKKLSKESLDRLIVVLSREITKKRNILNKLKKVGIIGGVALGGLYVGGTAAGAYLKYKERKREHPEKK